MTSTDDAYQSSMDGSISDIFRKRSSSRNRKATLTSTENTTKRTLLTKRTDKQCKTVQQRVVTRSSQKSSAISTLDDTDNSFMSNINTGFSQFVNPKKRQRDDKKMKTMKRSKITTYADENQSPNDEIHDIEQVKLIYETSDGRTNLARAAATNAQIVANRNILNIRQPIVTNTTYNLNDHNHIIDDTLTDTLIIPDTIVDNDTQHNDSSWQREIDRLMRKLEEPSSTARSRTQIIETQTEEEILEPIYLSQTRKTQLRPIQTIKNITQSEINQQKQIQTTTITETGEIGIQTENNLNSSSIHECCQDVSMCPCVLRYSKLERLFMEKMSRFISIVPTLPNSDQQVIIPETRPKRRIVQSYSRFRRFRARRKAHDRMIIPSISNSESTIIEEISDEVTTESDNQPKDNVKITQEMNQSIPSTATVYPRENIVSTTITIEKNPQSIDDLSSIEKLDATEIVDHTSTLLISSTANTCSTARRLVLTTSSLDENQKSRFRLFITRFCIPTSSTVDSTTTHVIVNDNSSLICPLTGKIIQGIGRHLFIVSHRWLNECLSQESIVDERPYEIRGDTSLGSDHGGMRRSRLTPSYLLDKYSICLRCSSSDCAPLQTLEQVQELVELCGAKLVQNFSEIKIIDKERQMVLVLGINGFSGGEKKRKALLDTCQQFNVRCVNIHWLLISIAKFDIQPFENYDINPL
ncbi:unnamed protein product [Rotaria socialis]|uniref:BRCT domain-containing protein n=1 Tax=Rotaria socialis TaxID=392032 RepID=A0A819WS17_9BILA|nr:unnamed protein product [Rotaria socialis]CAF3318685.1 unnamed protein product [Rotaria socialis]CAF3357122.1 unnamed protein product [Rotaria socialis]CAF4126722.1 unnamed protein product [Rotaria socialis]CAF4452270.1 unnamed protein product [Rotaria socialis]